MPTDAPALGPAMPTVPDAPRHAVPLDPDITTARRWAVAVLGLATAAALVYGVLVVLGLQLAAAALTVATGRHDLSVDLLAVLGGLAPGLLVGWCIGLATNAAIGRGDALGPRLAGVTAGLVGTVAGIGILAVGPLL